MSSFIPVGVAFWSETRPVISNELKVLPFICGAFSIPFDGALLMCASSGDMEPMMNSDQHSCSWYLRGKRKDSELGGAWHGSVGVVWATLYSHLATVLVELCSTRTQAPKYQTVSCGYVAYHHRNRVLRGAVEGTPFLEGRSPNQSLRPLPSHGHLEIGTLQWLYNAHTLRKV